MASMYSNRYKGDNTKAIDDFNQKALEMGMSYGQHSAYLYQQSQAELRNRKKKESVAKSDVLCV